MYQTMSLLSVCFIFSLYILSKSVAVKGYTYQTEPLFLSVSELAALEANSHFGDPDGIIPAPGDDKVKTFAVICHEDSIEVVIQAHLFDPDLPVEPTQLWLGHVIAAQDHCVAKASGNGEYIIRAPLAECGNKVMFTESAVLYSNLLQYSPPPPSPGDTFRLEQVAIPVQCEYNRRYTVSSRSLKPTWSPFISVQAAHLNLDFHLRLMSNDWSHEKKSPVYFLGETVNIEASLDHHHPSLRLYVGSCVATLTSDVTSHPRYPLIDHQGCFTDSQLSGSSSHFLPRVQDNLLQIELEPFLFYQDDRRIIYITCYLEAVPISEKEPVKRACSFIRGRWMSVDGDDDICESCESASSHKRVQRSQREHSRTDLHRETTVGPLVFLPWKVDGSGSPLSTEV